MAQLKMYWLPGTPIKDVRLPEGYSIRKFSRESDKLAWVECCKNGLVADDADEKTFYNDISSNPAIDLFNDVFFLDDEGISWVEETLASMTLEEKAGQVFFNVSGGGVAYRIGKA